MSTSLAFLRGNIGDTTSWVIRNTIIQCLVLSTWVWSNSSKVWRCLSSLINSNRMLSCRRYRLNIGVICFLSAQWQQKSHRRSCRSLRILISDTPCCMSHKEPMVHQAMNGESLVQLTTDNTMTKIKSECNRLSNNVENFAEFCF